MNKLFYFFLIFAFISFSFAQGSQSQADIDQAYANCMKEHCKESLLTCAADDLCVTIAKECHKKLLAAGSQSQKTLEFKNCLSQNQKANNAYQCQFTNRCTPQ